jgi:hypothetical protein
VKYRSRDVYNNNAIKKGKIEKRTKSHRDVYVQEGKNKKRAGA